VSITEQSVLDEYEAGELSILYETEPPEEILAWALDRSHPRIAISEGGGAEGMAILDIAVRIRPDVRVFTLDTGRLPQETYDLIERVHDRYGVRIEMLLPEASHIQEMMRGHGRI
jgi:3'-phosphoadenosine 5'-phosphosulfate sulfotransferase (PAPS reductase)/FAD synthetase